MINKFDNGNTQSQAAPNLFQILAHFLDQEVPSCSLTAPLLAATATQTFQACCCRTPSGKIKSQSLAKNHQTVKGKRTCASSNSNAIIRPLVDADGNKLEFCETEFSPQTEGVVIRTKIAQDKEKAGSTVRRFEVPLGAEESG